MYNQIYFMKYISMDNSRLSRVVFETLACLSRHFIYNGETEGSVASFPGPHKTIEKTTWLNEAVFKVRLSLWEKRLNSSLQSKPIWYVKAWEDVQGSRGFRSFCINNYVTLGFPRAMSLFKVKDWFESAYFQFLCI